MQQPDFHSAHRALGTIDLHIEEEIEVWIPFNEILQEQGEGWRFVELRVLANDTRAGKILLAVSADAHQFRIVRLGRHPIHWVQARMRRRRGRLGPVSWQPTWT